MRSRFVASVRVLSRGVSDRLMVSLLGGRTTQDLEINIGDRELKATGAYVQRCNLCSIEAVLFCIFPVSMIR